jgi:hypothetical protein
VARAYQSMRYMHRRQVVLPHHQTEILKSFDVLRVRATKYNTLSVQGIVTALLFNVIDRETKELLPRSIFIITRHYKKVEIRR